MEIELEIKNLNLEDILIEDSDITLDKWRLRKERICSYPHIQESLLQTDLKYYLKLLLIINSKDSRDLKVLNDETFK